MLYKLKENKFLYVHDYARNIQKDLFSYIMSQRHVEFSDVLNEVKKVIGITDYYDFFERRGIFGGFYEKITFPRCPGYLCGSLHHIHHF